ncbi:MAG: translation initiation factor IF-2 [Candidatus Schekmanbacteria bacterium]|nr:translation initiation factor IF-2 [Candidatus Schekmanbacteria bacterium]
MRVHELAKKLGINSKQLITQLNQRGLDVKNHMGMVPEETVNHFLQVASSIKASPSPKVSAPPEKKREQNQTQFKVKEPQKISPQRSFEREKPKETRHQPSPGRKEAPSFKPYPKFAGKPAPKTAPQPTPKVKPVIVPVAKVTGPVEIIEGITLKELAQKMEIKSNDLIKHLITKGKMLTLNQVLDLDLATDILKDFNLAPQLISLEVSKETLLEANIEDKGKITHRPPVVTIMGHVDHGKTLLLDAIRSTNIVSQEAGGITQHIGAYKVKLPNGEVTFLDTPGHEAFTAMRARGAQVTDIVVLVVAADDGVMPQTIEAINHAREAKVPIVVAVNKIDKPEASPERVRQELMKYELVSEEWGGKTIFVDVSAKRKIGLENLLAMLLLEAEMLELKANSKRAAMGTIIEAKLDKGRGPVATVLIQDGTLKLGDPFVCGLHFGKVRALISDKGEKLEEATPSTPVEVLGFSGVPQAGDSFAVVADERKAHQIAQMRQEKARETSLSKMSSRISLADLHRQIKEGAVQELKLIIKTDVQGSVEAINDALSKVGTEKVQIKTIHWAVGAITEMDVMLASASNAIIVGFNVRPQPKAAQLAIAEGVDVRLYTIIYNLIADVKAAMQGLLAPVYTEQLLGRAQVKETFTISRIGTIAGTYVQDGKITRNAKVRLLRDNVVIYEGVMESLRRFKDEAKEVTVGYECGIKIAGYNDIKLGDVIEAFILEETPAQLV